MVCKLQKSLYDMKQVSQNWNSKFTLALHQLDFTQSKLDYSLFTKQHGASFVALLVYVDDILLASSDMTTVNFIKSSVKN